MNDSQGAASNRNGQRFEKEVARLLEEAGFSFECQIKRYPGPNPCGHTHDFVVQTTSGPVVIECKSFSGQPGSIWEKLLYTIVVLSRHGVKSALVLGGSVPTDWRRSFLNNFGSAHGVKVIKIEEVVEMLNG